MPKLVSVDVSVTDSRISLTFSHSAVASSYASYLTSEDRRPAHAQPIPGYRRHATLNTKTRQVTLALPSFITWFITCRLPDDEDSVTFTFMDSHDEYAQLWAESMVLFERVPGCDAESGGDDGAVKQLHVRRLWNRAKLMEQLDVLRREGTNARAERNVDTLARLPGVSGKMAQADPDMWWR